jgi:hypothetical protein
MVGGHQIAFDGFGQRDHSWGFRHWAGLHQWHWVTGFADDGHAFNLFEVHTHDDTTSVNGYVHRSDGDDYVTGVDRVLVRADDGGAATLQMTLTTAGGVTTISGERAASTVPVRPAEDQPAIVYETPIRLMIDGVPGYGVYEHLVTEFD